MNKRIASGIAALLSLVALAPWGGALPTRAEGRSVEILSAEYGQPGDKRSVTETLKSRVSGGAVASFTVDDSSMGTAPAGEATNRLVVCYRENGVTKYACVAKGGTLELPYRYDPVQPEETRQLMEKPLTTTTQEKVWPETGLRGFNFGGLVGNYSANPGEEGMYVTESTFRRLKEMGVNCLRIPMAVDQGYAWSSDTIPADDPVAPYRHHLEALKVALHLAEKYDMYIIPSGDNVVGRKIDIMYNETDGSGYNATLNQLWGYIAANYGAHPRLIGYDLLNEPNTANDAAYYMDTVLPMLVKTIRAVDKNTYLIVESQPFAFPGKFRDLLPLDDPKVVYSFHFYWPHQYTHQRIGDYTASLSYPGNYGNFPTDSPLLWNKAQLEASVQEVVKFQQKYNVKVWIGEFGAVRWAGNAGQWIRDTISIWEKYGWDWCYHSYGGYDGFNPTFSASSTPSNKMDGGVDTALIQALQAGFALNGQKRATTTTTGTGTTTTTAAPTTATRSHTTRTQPTSGDATGTQEPDLDGMTVLESGGIRVASATLDSTLTLTANRLSKGEEYDRIKAALPAGTKGFIIYDLALTDASGSDTAPDKPVEVVIPLSKGMDDVVVYHVDASGKWSAVSAYLSEKYVAFSAPRLGRFVILKPSASAAASVSGTLSPLTVGLWIAAGAVLLLDIGLVVWYCVTRRRKQTGDAVRA